MDGAFALTPERAGDYVLTIAASYHARLEVAVRDFDPASGLDLGPLELLEGGALTGRIVPGPGQRAAGTVVALSRGDRYPRSQRVDRDGRFHFEHLTPGTWQLCESPVEFSSEGGRAFAPQGPAPEQSPGQVRIDDARVTHVELHALDGRVVVLR